MKTPWPFRHLWLKVLSVSLAALMWLVVSGEETVERGMRVPLELQQFPAGLELQGEPPSLVDVRVRGSSGTLGRLSPGDVVAVLDFRGAHAGRRVFQISAEQVRAPFGVQVVQVTPASIAVTFENSSAKLVPVVAVVEGKPAPGYITGKPVVDPREIEIVGPASSVERATEALTEAVMVTGARDRVIESVAVGLPDPSLRLKVTKPATVTVPVLPGPVERLLRDRPIHLRNLAAGLTAQALPPSADVVVRGSREGLARTGVGGIVAYVDLAGLGSGAYSLSVQVDASPEAGVARIDPSAVQVRISSGKN